MHILKKNIISCKDEKQIWRRKKQIPKNNLSNDNLWKEFEKKLKKKKENNYFQENNNLFSEKKTLESHIKII